jgi:hypothetical protein
MSNAKAKLLSEIESASAYILELEAKFYQAQRTSLELLK